MMSRDRDALLCDLAQTYQIYRLDALPAADTARLAAGLPPDSRIMRAMSGQKVPMTELLLAAVVDELRLLRWSRTKNGQRNRHRPRSMVELLTGEENGPADDTERYETPEAFEAARAEIADRLREEPGPSEETGVKNP